VTVPVAALHLRNVHQEVGANLGSDQCIVFGEQISRRVLPRGTLGDQDLAHKDCTRVINRVREERYSWWLHVLKVLVEDRQLRVPYIDPLTCLAHFSATPIMALGEAQAVPTAKKPTVICAVKGNEESAREGATAIVSKWIWRIAGRRRGNP
jgi:hypothetical protein